MAAATQTVPTLLTLDEYLRTSYHPDCDFVDDHIEERTMGTILHGMLQMQLGFWFVSRRKEWNIRVSSEVRTRVSEGRVRLPDVAVMWEDDAVADKVLATPPLIAIEILSPEDRFYRVIPRLQEFQDMGVEHIWVLDPVDRVAYILTTAGGLRPFDGPRLTVPNTPIFLDLPEIFAALD